MLTQVMLAAIRQCADDQHEWIDLQTLSGLATHTRTLANQGNAACGPAWTRDNPVVRIATVIITEKLT